MAERESLPPDLESEPSVPEPHVDVIDVDAKYKWLGYWEPCALSAYEWRLCHAAVPLDGSVRGHALDVAIVLGHKAGAVWIDDVVVQLTVTPPPALQHASSEDAALAETLSGLIKEQKQAALVHMRAGDMRAAKAALERAKELGDEFAQVHFCRRAPARRPLS